MTVRTCAAACFWQVLHAGEYPASAWRPTAIMCCCRPHSGITCWGEGQGQTLGSMPSTSGSFVLQAHVQALHAEEQDSAQQHSLICQNQVIAACLTLLCRCCTPGNTVLQQVHSLLIQVRLVLACCMHVCRRCTLEDHLQQRRLSVLDVTPALQHVSCICCSLGIAVLLQHLSLVKSPALPGCRRCWSIAQPILRQRRTLQWSAKALPCSTAQLYMPPFCCRPLWRPCTLGSGTPPSCSSTASCNAL